MLGSPWRWVVRQHDKLVGILRSGLFDELQACVLTSATLAVAGSFDFFRSLALRSVDVTNCLRHLYFSTISCGDNWFCTVRF